jgi:hypothetical protein
LPSSLSATKAPRPPPSARFSHQSRKSPAPDNPAKPAELRTDKPAELRTRGAAGSRSRQASWIAPTGCRIPSDDCKTRRASGLSHRVGSARRHPTGPQPASQALVNKVVNNLFTILHWLFTKLDRSLRLPG